MCDHYVPPTSGRLHGDWCLDPSFNELSWSWSTLAKTFDCIDIIIHVVSVHIKVLLVFTLNCYSLILTYFLIWTSFIHFLANWNKPNNYLDIHKGSGVAKLSLSQNCSHLEMLGMVVKLHFSSSELDDRAGGCVDHGGVVHRRKDSIRQVKLILSKKDRPYRLHLYICETLTQTTMTA